MRYLTRHWEPVLRRCSTASSQTMFSARRKDAKQDLVGDTDCDFGGSVIQRLTCDSCQSRRVSGWVSTQSARTVWLMEHPCRWDVGGREHNASDARLWASYASTRSCPVTVTPIHHAYGESRRHRKSYPDSDGKRPSITGWATALTAA